MERKAGARYKGKVDSAGRVLIPAPLREKLGVQPGATVSITESMTKLIRQGGEPRLVERLLRALDLEVISWDEELAWASRDFCPLAWTNSISFADRACLTLARHLNLAAMTADSEWKKSS